MSNQRNKGSAPGPWFWLWAIILTPTVPFIGVMMLVYGIIKTIDQNNVSKKHPYDIAHNQYRENQNPYSSTYSTRKTTTTTTTTTTTSSGTQKTTTTSKTKAAGPASSGPIPAPPSGKGLMIAGAIIAGLFGFAFINEFFSMVGWASASWILEECMPLLAMAGGGAGMLSYPIFRKNRYNRYCRYLTLIGNQQKVSVASIAKVTGFTEKKVKKDLQDMLDKKYLPKGYIDVSTGTLYLSEEGIHVEPKRKKAEPAEKKEEDVLNTEGVLAAIRTVNDAIAQPELTKKIDRIEYLTRKILEQVKRNPSQESQIRSFMNYYLPTTLKILNSYAQLEAQGVEGENISSAKNRVEEMFDDVVNAFELQLDKLFRDQAIDLDSEIKTMEQKLKNDGLTTPDDSSATTSEGITLSI